MLKLCKRSLKRSPSSKALSIIRMSILLSLPTRQKLLNLMQGLTSWQLYMISTESMQNCLLLKACSRQLFSTSSSRRRITLARNRQMSTRLPLERDYKRLSENEQPAKQPQRQPQLPSIEPCRMATALQWLLACTMLLFRHTTQLNRLRLFQLSNLLLSHRTCHLNRLTLQANLLMRLKTRNLS